MFQENNFRKLKQFGFYTSILSAIFYILFDIAAIAGMTGVIKSNFIISISWYAPSLLLAYSFLGMIITLHLDEISDKSVYSYFAVIIGIIYVSLNSIVYIIQVLVIAPSFLNDTFANVSIFEMAEGKAFWAVNGLAYTLMGFSTLFMSFAITGKSINKAIKIMLFIHGIVAPAVLAAVFYEPAFIISATVGISYPVSAVAIALYMKKTLKNIYSE